MSSAAAHYHDAEAIMAALGLEAAKQLAELDSTEDPIAGLAALVGLVTSMLTAHTHATLALAAAVGEGNVLMSPDSEVADRWREALRG